MSDDTEHDVFECWCGAKGTYAELFDSHLFSESCGGSGILHCECGGDSLCVCHHHGEVECPGCEDCNDRDDDGMDDCYDEDEP